MQKALFFDIDKIYTLVHKCEKNNFHYNCLSRQWDGFVMVTEGEGVFLQGNTEKHIFKGDIIYLRKDERYTITSNKSFSYYTSAFDFADKSDPTLTLLQKISRCTPIQLKLISNMTESWQKKSADSYMFCKIQLLQLYYEALKDTTVDGFNYSDICINSATRFIHNNFKRNFSSKEIADFCSMSESHLRKKFLAATGFTIYQYRDFLRIKLAKELLSSGFYSVKETAYETGFYDVYYFTKFFLKHTKTTPGKFRNMQTKNE